MKKNFTLSDASPATLSLIIIAFYSLIVTITYFAWQ